MKDDKKIRVNVMLSQKLVLKLDEIVSPKKRSQFINAAIEEAITQRAKQIAHDNITAFRENHGLILPTDEELKKEIRYGLE